MLFTLFHSNCYLVAWALLSVGIGAEWTQPSTHELFSMPPGTVSAQFP